MGPPNGKQKEWSPYAWTQTWGLDYINSRYLVSVTDVKFDQAAINYWVSHDVPWFGWQKYTLDVTEIGYNGQFKVSSDGYWASNLPNPYFDRDDDPYPNGDGYWEEVEVTAVFTGYFQLSLWFFAEGELGYQAIESDPLQDFEAYIPTIIGGALRYLGAGTMPVGAPGFASENSETVQDRVVFASSLTTHCRYALIEKGIDRYRLKILPILQNQQDFIEHSSWLSARANELEGSSPDCQIPVAITFNRPLSVEQLTSFVGDYNVNVGRFEAKVLPHDGRLWTIGGVPTETALVDNDEFNALLGCIRTNTGDDNPEVLGICALWGTVAASRLASLQEDNLVLLVDVSPAIILREVQQHGFTGSFAWSLPDVFEDAIRYNVI
jgi:hypothetical protein